MAGEHLEDRQDSETDQVRSHRHNQEELGGRQHHLSSDVQKNRDDSASHQFGGITEVWAAVQAYTCGSNPLVKLAINFAINFTSSKWEERSKENKVSSGGD